MQTEAKTRKKPTRSPKPSGDQTPAMRQYAEQKQQVGDAILLFRMGDFYETFHDDAVTAARVLGIALTSRNKDSDQPIPLAGIPYHALEPYLKKLVSAGYKVAISEQVEDPKTAKGVVKRDVVRIVTAGTLTDDALLDEKSENILACVCLDSASAGLATVELAGGRLMVHETLGSETLDELVRIGPAELIIDDERGGASETLATRLQAARPTAIARRSAHDFAAHNAEKTLLNHFDTTTLAGFGFDRMTLSLRAAGVIVAYLRETQKTSLDHITGIARRQADRYVRIDQNTWRSLEIDRTLRNGLREGSLLDAIDRTVHPIGARRLREWICMPLVAAKDIVERQDAVGEFVDDDALRTSVRRTLKTISDVERIAARVALLRVSPRDLLSLAQSLAKLPPLEMLLADIRSPLLADARKALGGLEALSELLGNAVHPEAPPVLRDGGVIADGYNAELDRLRAIRNDGQAFLAAYQKELVESAGIPTLKVGFNKVFGYYIEVPNTYRDRTPPDFVRRQTVRNAERYITQRLKDYEQEVLSAADKAVALETRLFEELRLAVAEQLDPLKRVASAIGLLDTAAALAELAAERRFVRPQMVDDGMLTIEEGRHPVLDQTMPDSFVPNDATLGPTGPRVQIVTGPNMAGKSTYVRQVALLTLLAQSGSFVPARTMTLSPADRVFARVGAADEIARGQSTFMVEMTEAATILNTATDRSLVILDEIGRGTSTFDGLSLAWAITEHIANVIRCRALVATHYHELTELADLLDGVRNCSVAVREYDDAAGEGHIVFLHKIVEGRTDKSYGIHVARMAGVPKPVIARSKEILDELHQGFARDSQATSLAAKRTRRDDQLPLFTDPVDEIIKALRNLDVDNMTPLQALNKLHEIMRSL